MFAALAWTRIETGHWVGFDQARLWYASAWSLRGEPPPDHGLEITGIGRNAPWLPMLLGGVLAVWPTERALWATAIAAFVTALALLLQRARRPWWVLAAAMHPGILLSATAAIDYGLTMLPAAAAWRLLDGHSPPRRWRTAAVGWCAGLMVSFHFATAPWAIGLIASSALAQARGSTPARRVPTMVMHGLLAAAIAAVVLLPWLEWATVTHLPGLHRTGVVTRLAHAGSLQGLIFGADVVYWQLVGARTAAALAAIATGGALLALMARPWRHDPAVWGLVLGWVVATVVFSIRDDYLALGHVVVGCLLFYARLAGVADVEPVSTQSERLLHWAAVIAVTAQALGWANVVVGPWALIPPAWMNAYGQDVAPRIVLGLRGRRAALAAMDAQGGIPSAQLFSAGRGLAAAQMNESMWYRPTADIPVTTPPTITFWLEPAGATVPSIGAALAVDRFGPGSSGADLSPPPHALPFSSSGGFPRTEPKDLAELGRQACPVTRCTVVSDLWTLDRQILPRVGIGWDTLDQFRSRWLAGCDQIAVAWGMWSRTERCIRSVAGGAPLHPPSAVPESALAARFTLAWRPATD